MKFANPLDCPAASPTVGFYPSHGTIMQELNRRLSCTNGITRTIISRAPVRLIEFWGSSTEKLMHYIAWNSSVHKRFGLSPQSASQSIVSSYSTSPWVMPIESESHLLIYFDSGLGAFSFPHERVSGPESALHESIYSNFKGYFISVAACILSSRRMDISGTFQKSGSRLYSIMDPMNDYFGSSRTTGLGDSATVRTLECISPTLLFGPTFFRPSIPLITGAATCDFRQLSRSIQTSSHPQDPWNDGHLCKTPKV